MVLLDTLRELREEYIVPENTEELYAYVDELIPLDQKEGNLR